MSAIRLVAISLLFVAGGGCLALPARGDTEVVAKEEAGRWLRQVIPLPREAAIPRKALVPRGQIAIVLSQKPSVLERAAAAELAATLKPGGGNTLDQRNETPAALEIRLGVCDPQGRLGGREVPGARRLFTLPNRWQAYRIAPLDDRTLGLAGTDPKGVYYAAKTLQQLLKPSAMGGPVGKLAIPLAEVTDWPDLAERGLWGGSANEDIEWMADRKMNLVESHVDLTLDAAGRGVAHVPERLLERARLHAVNFVPIITHLEQLPPAVLARHPQLKAVGDEDRWKRIGEVRPVCFSQPKAQEILSDWLASLARYPDVTDICFWLSENDVPCGCGQCKQVNPFVLQTRLALRAWEAARKVRPELRLRILLTQGSYASNAQVLAAAGPDAGITYYDGGRTYDSSRQPMIYPLLEQFAAEGRWLGCYPQLTASWRIVCPWTGPQFIKARMNEFVTKRLQCLCGYATPSNRFYEFNVTAAAEWSWNASGRSEQEFAAAWATGKGIADPEKAAQWAVTVGPVGWNLYGSRVPYGWIYGNVNSIVRPGSRPKLGAGLLTYFPTPERFESDLAACRRALALAQSLKSSAMIEETRVLVGLLEMLQGFYEMGEAAAPGKKMTATDRQRLTRGLTLADRGNVTAREALLAWGAAVAPELAGTGRSAPSRFRDTVACLDRVMTQAGDLAISLGAEDPGRPYRLQSIGQWKTEDFKSGAAQTKTWEVTRFLQGPGKYRVDFQYDKGWVGAQIRNVTLVAKTDESGPPKEVARDEHRGVTGYQPKRTSYLLALEAHPPKQRYFVVADLVGVSPNAPPDRSGCEGHATIVKVKE